MVDAVRDREEVLDPYALVEANVTDVVLVGDREGRISWVSPSVRNLLGREPDELLGDGAWSLTHPDDAATVRAGVDEALRTGRSRFDVRILDGDGASRWVEITLRPVQPAQGQATTLIAVWHECGERRAAEAVARERERELIESQRVAGIGSWTLDLATRRGHWSDGMFRIHHLPPAAEPPSYSDYPRPSSPAARAERERKMAATMQDGTPYEHAYETVLADGTVKQFLARAEAVRDEAGQIVSLRGTLLDITAMRALEERAARAERHVALGRMAEGVARDFENLLLGLEMATNRLAARSSDPQVRHELPTLRDAIEDGRTMTRQLIELARPPRERATDTDAADLLGWLASVAPSVLGPRVAVRVTAPPVGTSARVAPLALQDALLGLMTAARDAITSEGHLELEGAAEELGVEAAAAANLEAGRWIRLTLTHDGAPIHEADLAHILDPFGSDEPAGLTTALRLPLAAAFARASGGGMTVESAPGRTAYHLYLPPA